MISNILVLTAFQEGSRRALAMAAEVALRFEGRVHVLHVIEEDHVEVISTAMVPTPGDSGVQPPTGSNLPPTLGQHFRPAVNLDDVASGLVARAERQMRDFVAHLDSRLLLTTEVRIGKPHEVIIETVAARHVDFVVMGRSSHGLKEFLLGSIADKVVRTVACPVCLL
jgi:nucleotide-binding universal stress UspA family protein